MNSGMLNGYTLGGASWLAAVVPPPASLKAAVKARALADATLSGLLTAGGEARVAFDMIPAGTSLPYLVMTMPDASIEYISNTSQVMAGRLRFRAYGKVAADCGAVAAAVQAAFAGQALAWQDGWTAPLVLASRGTGKEMDRGRGGTFLYFEDRAFRVRIYAAR